MTFEELQKYGQDQIDRAVQANIKTITAEYTAVYKSINDQLKTFYATNLVGLDKSQYYIEMVKFNRLLSLQASIAEEYNKVATKAGVITKQTSELAMANNFYWQQYATNWLSPYSFTVLNEKIIEYSVTGRADLIASINASIKNPQLKRDLAAIAPGSGKTLKELIVSNRDQQVGKIFSTITQGLIRGSSITNMSKEIKTVESISKYAAERIARTEAHRNASAGGFLQWQSAKAKGVEGVRVILSTKDTRTRPQSAQVDGRRDEGEGFLYPDGKRYLVPGNTGNPSWDINDRERVLYEIDGELPTVERARNPVTGQNEVIKATSFDEWATSHGLSYNKSGKLVKK